MKFKDLSKVEKNHLKRQGITTLKAFKSLAEYQKEIRTKCKIEPCFCCKHIATQLGLEV